MYSHPCFCTKFRKDRKQLVLLEGPWRGWSMGFALCPETKTTTKTTTKTYCIVHKFDIQLQLKLIDYCIIYFNTMGFFFQIAHTLYKFMRFWTSFFLQWERSKIIQLVSTHIFRETFRFKIGVTIYLAYYNINSIMGYGKQIWLTCQYIFSQTWIHNNIKL